MSSASVSNSVDSSVNHPHFPVHKVQTDLSGRGVNFIREPHIIVKMADHELWLAEFRDSEGNVMALMEEKR